jgi:hypothetical protein
MRPGAFFNEIEIFGGREEPLNTPRVDLLVSLLHMVIWIKGLPESCLEFWSNESAGYSKSFISAARRPSHI